MRARALPQVDQPVTVLFLAGRAAGTIVAVDEDLRGLEVATADGELIRFVLQRTSGRFQSDGQLGARLYFDDDGPFA